MRKIPLQIDELKFINEFFDGEMCLCGGIADFIYTGYNDISDIDLLIKESAFMRSMGIQSMESNPVINKYNFCINRVVDSVVFRELAPHENFYAGLYKTYPIDIFIVRNLNENIFLPEYNTLKYGICIVSPYDRIHKCKNTLSAKIDSNTPKSSAKWLNKKQKQAQHKLKLYKEKYT